MSIKVYYGNRYKEGKTDHGLLIKQLPSGLYCEVFHPKNVHKS